MKIYRYYGLLVRVSEHADSCLLIEQSNTVAGGWLEVKRYPLSSPVCYSEAYDHAQKLSNYLQEKATT